MSDRILHDPEQHPMNTSLEESKHRSPQPQAPLRTEDILCNGPPAYKYAPLLHDHHVRVMLLQPAHDLDSVLQCRLVDSPLGRDAFEAVSYVWGSTDNPSSILCSEAPLKITRNLDEALRYLRHKRAERALWVDAVCINQEDDAEKQAQIPLMREIYTSAARSLVWLGPAEEGIAVGFRVVRLISPQVTLLNRGLDQFHKYVGNESALHNNVNQSGSKVAIIDSFVHKLFRRDWFTRTWTIQELLLNERSAFVCGEHQVSSKVLAWYVSGTAWIDPTRLDLAAYPRQGQILLQYFNKHTSTPLQSDALQLMLVVKSAATSNPEDKVIGIQAILQQIGLKLPHFTSSMNIQYLYTALTRAWINHWKDYAILAFAGQQGATPDLKSWVVDWNDSEQKDGHLIANYYTRLAYLRCSDSVSHRRISATCGHAMSMEAFTSDDRLILRGIRLANVARFVNPSGISHQAQAEHYSPRNLPELPLEIWARSCRALLSWVLFLDELTREYLLSQILDSLASILNVAPTNTIHCDYRSAHMEKDFRKIVSLKLYEHAPDAELKTHVQSSALAKLKLWQAMRLRVDTETLFVTQDGRLGLTTCRILQSDSGVVLAAGSDFPAVLAPSNRFLGLAIVSGTPGDHERERAEKYKNLWNNYEDRPWDTCLLEPGLRSFGTKRLMANPGHIISSTMRGKDWPMGRDTCSLESFTVS